MSPVENAWYACFARSMFTCCAVEAIGFHLHQLLPLGVPAAMVRRSGSTVQLDSV
jgi:hypothetical protein